MYKKLETNIRSQLNAVCYQCPSICPVCSMYVLYATQVESVFVCMCACMQLGSYLLQASERWWRWESQSSLPLSQVKQEFWTIWTLEREFRLNLSKQLWVEVSGSKGGQDVWRVRGVGWLPWCPQMKGFIALLWSYCNTCEQMILCGDNGVEMHPSSFSEKRLCQGWFAKTLCDLLRLFSYRDNSWEMCVHTWCKMF